MRRLNCTDEQQDKIRAFTQSADSTVAWRSQTNGAATDCALTRHKCEAHITITAIALRPARNLAFIF
jgi:hypothetical protein